MGVVNDLARLCGCAGMLEPWLFVDKISTKISCADCFHCHLYTYKDLWTVFATLNDNYLNNWIVVKII